MSRKQLKKVLQINLGNFGSTGKIMAGIAEVARDCNYSVINAYPDSSHYSSNLKDYVICSSFWHNLGDKIYEFTGYGGFITKYTTIKLIKKIDAFKPDIIQLHNLHINYINFPLLFKYIKLNKIKIVWTLHDCWSFTGRCPYFALMGCQKWINGCHDCEYPKKDYPPARLDKTNKMWNLKKKLFTGIRDMIIVTPSQWLADLVKQSFLKDYPIKVINNGIDLTVFKPLKSDFRERHGIKGNEYILLGIAFSWGKRKGLDVFIELSKRLSDEYKIVLVGTNDNIDKQLPANIISIHRTQNQTELAEIYSASNLFVNPTREDNYPTVNMESIACGTPVLTFKTGGSPEILDETCGSVVDCDDVDALEKEVIRICETKPYSKEACLKHAKSFDMKDKFKEYIDLYEQL